MDRFTDIQLKVKECPMCEHVKPVYEFYERVDGEANTYCKSCVIEYNKTRPRIPKGKTNINSYDATINALRQNGIPATPGKLGPYKATSIWAWGAPCVNVKVSSSRLCEGSFLFGLKQKQVDADIVILVVIDEHESETFHVFDADDPVFYLNGSPKTGVQYKPERAWAHESSASLTKQQMQEAKNRWSLIERKRLEWIERAKASND